MKKSVSMRIINNNVTINKYLKIIKICWKEYVNGVTTIKMEDNVD